MPDRIQNKMIKKLSQEHRTVVFSSVESEPGDVYVTVIDTQSLPPHQMRAMQYGKVITRGGGYLIAIRVTFSEDFKDERKVASTLREWRKNSRRFPTRGGFNMLDNRIISVHEMAKGERCIDISLKIQG